MVARGGILRVIGIELTIRSQRCQRKTALRGTHSQGRRVVLWAKLKAGAEAHLYLTWTVSLGFGDTKAGWD